MELVRLQDAAREFGISYPTLKQWIYRRRIRSVKTPGGHHRIPRSEIDRLTRDRRPRPRAQAAPVELHAVSGRNKLLGVIREVRYEGLLAQVSIDVGGQTVTSIITRNAAKELGLRRGMSALALIKATEVMIALPSVRGGSK